MTKETKLKPCPFCRSKGEKRPGSDIPPTLEEALEQELNGRCSNPHCGAHYLIMGLKEWNTRKGETND